MTIGNIMAFNYALMNSFPEEQRHTAICRRNIVADGNEIAMFLKGKKYQCAIKKNGDIVILGENFEWYVTTKEVAMKDFLFL